MSDVLPVAAGVGVLAVAYVYASTLKVIGLTFLAILYILNFIIIPMLESSSTGETSRLLPSCITSPVEFIRKVNEELTDAIDKLTRQMTKVKNAVPATPVFSKFSIKLKPDFFADIGMNKEEKKEINKVADKLTAPLAEAERSFEKALNFLDIFAIFRNFSNKMSEFFDGISDLFNFSEFAKSAQNITNLVKSNKAASDEVATDAHDIVNFPIHAVIREFLQTIVYPSTIPRWIIAVITWVIIFSILMPVVAVCLYGMHLSRELVPMPLPANVQAKIYK